MPRYESAAASSGTPFHYLPFQESKRLWKSFSLTRDVSASVCCPTFLKVTALSVPAFLLPDEENTEQSGIGTFPQSGLRRQSQNDVEKEESPAERRESVRTIQAWSLYELYSSDAGEQPAARTTGHPAGRGEEEAVHDQPDVVHLLQEQCAEEPYFEVCSFPKCEALGLQAK